MKRKGKASEPALMKSILVAVDGSEPSRKGIKLAMEMAGKWKSKVYVLHVIDPVAMREMGLPEFTFFQNPRDDYIESREDNKHVDVVCEQQLDPAEEELRKSGVEVETICASGHPADQILNTAKKYNVDVIIMGNRGRGSFSKATMGSVPNKVCNHTETTCIIVK